jgi:nucleoside-diphosphate-sugar epimerase
MILCTGGYGFIGSALVKALVTSGQKVRVLDNIFRGNSDRLKDIEHEFWSGDVRNLSDVVPASKGCDEIIHLAFINGTENFYSMPDIVLEVGVKGICNVLDACQVNNIPNLLLASSSEVYQSAAEVPTTEKVPLVIPDPFNARYSYAAGKIISEMMCIHNMDRFEKMVIVRPHNVYGPDMGNEHVIPQMAQRIKVDGELVFLGQEPPEVMNKNGARVFWGLVQTRSCCYISDAVASIMIAREHGIHGQIYNIGNEDEIAIIELARKIAGIAGKSVQVRSMDGSPMTPGSPGECLRRCPDISKIAALGYRQTITLDAGLRKTLEWYWR